MATADFDLTMNVECELEEAKALIEVLRKYSEGEKGVYFSYMEVDGNDVEDDLEDFFDDFDGAMEVTALGPYGSYMMLNDVDIFRDLAEVAPNAKFDAEITGCTSYTEQSINCELEDGILHISTYFESNDDAPEAYEKYFLGKVPYQYFIDFFGIDGDEFDEDSYKTLINDVFCYFDGDSFEEIEYDEFIGNLNFEIDEDTFNEFVSNIDAMNFYEFRDESKCGIEEEFFYDPTTKQYVEK